MAASSLGWPSKGGGSSGGGGVPEPPVPDGGSTAGIGAYANCAPGATTTVQCFFDGYGYIADVLYTNNLSPYSEVSLCGQSQAGLAGLSVTRLQLSAAEVVLALTACSDASGLRGLVLTGSRGGAYACGSRSGSCVTASSGAGAGQRLPLGGFSGTCVSARGGSRVRVGRINSACWNPYYDVPTSPAGRCAARALAHAERRLTMLSRPLPAATGRRHRCAQCACQALACPAPASPAAPAPSDGMRRAGPRRPAGAAPTARRR